MTEFNEDEHVVKNLQKQPSDRGVTRNAIGVWQKEMKKNENKIFFGVKFSNDLETDLQIKYALYALIGKRGAMGQFYTRVKIFFDKNKDIEDIIESGEHKKFQVYLFKQGIIQDKEWPLLEIVLRVIARNNLANNEDFKNWKEYNNKIGQQNSSGGQDRGTKGRVIQKQKVNFENSKEISSKIVKIIEGKINNIGIEERNELVGNSEKRALIIRSIINVISNEQNYMQSMDPATRFVLIDNIFMEKLHKYIAALKK